MFTLGKAFGERVPSRKLNFLSLLKSNPKTDITTDPVEPAEKRKGNLLMIQEIGEEDV